MNTDRSIAQSRRAEQSAAMLRAGVKEGYLAQRRQERVAHWVAELVEWEKQQQVGILAWMRRLDESDRDLP